MRKLFRSVAVATLCVALAAPAIAAPSRPAAANWNTLGREIFAEAVNMRTAVGNNATPQLAEALAARFRAAGFPEGKTSTSCATRTPPP